MKRTYFFLCLFYAVTVSAQTHWVKVKDAYKIHERYVIREHDGTDFVLGEYYELDGIFIAQCYPGEPVSFVFRDDARKAVLGCRN